MSRASSLKSCLSFIHIPKNMGGSIESSLIKAYKFKASAESPSCAFRARSSNIKERLWGVCDDKIRCSRSTHWPWQEGQHAWPGCTVAPNAPRSIPESIRQLAGKTSCSPWHFPPAFDPTVAASYTKDCDSFCVVRDPMHRYLSQLRTMHPMKDVCDPQKLEQLTQKALNAVDLKIDCHLIPQVYYVYQDGEPTAPRICHHILKYESMSSEFPALMGKYGLGKVNLTQQNAHRGHHCNVTPTSATVRMVASFYSKDYKAFGFAARQAMVALQYESV
ncbi:unnamed protein product [Symbiodinium pilosum]|uniref:Sulfotransferase domain-containing protein n=1 Tax=Symbiodinium pilosum TaxID=2952 RepID=A0A812X006_SYMPI|nr:unnamed protein product [Symbiodinium pilosum]